MKTSFFIDGYNLYYSLRRSFPNDPQYKWLHLKTLCESLLGTNDSLGDIYFFTAYFKNDPEKKARLRAYIRAIESNGAISVLGKFKKKTVRCWVNNCLCVKADRYFETFEEKESDVNIAVYLLENAMINTYEKAIIVSGDSDLIPAVKAVKRNFPHKKIGVALPPNQEGIDIAQHCDFKIKISTKQIREHKMENILYLPDGMVSCPYI